MSLWLKNNPSAELQERDGKADYSLKLHNGEIYERRIREEYDQPKGWNVQLGDGSKLERPERQVMPSRPVDPSEPQELQIHIMTPEEVAAAERDYYDKSHYSMEESFLKDWDEGHILNRLKTAATGGDLLKSVETFSYEAARYSALVSHFFGESESAGGLTDKMSALIDEAMGH